MLLKKLTEANGLPGLEKDVRNLIIEEIKDYVDTFHIDKLGNLIAVKNNHITEGKHIALSAHMDEVGVVVQGITSDGFLKISSWGVDPRILVAKAVFIGKNKIPGVIGSKPVHLVTVEERKHAIKIEDLYVDIGTFSKEETEKLVSLGDFIAFDSKLIEFGNNKIKAKALDDRVGCAIIIEILKLNLPYKLTAIFNAQEEVGLRGSHASSNQVFADLYLNIEGTICADTSGIPEHLHVTTQGNGAAISMSDKGAIYQKKYIDRIVKVGTDNNIKVQMRRSGMGGTDAANFHTKHGGTPVIGLAVPCRYIHSPVSVLDIRDYNSVKNLAIKFIEDFNKKEEK